MRLAALPLALALWCAAAAARGEFVDGVAAVVDKDVILYSDVQLTARIALDRMQAQSNAPLSEDTVQGVLRDALETLIETRLVQQYAQRANLVAEPEEIDRAVQSIATDEGLTPDEIYQAAASQGLSRDAYRRELGSQITRMKVMSGAVRSRVNITDEEVYALYEERYASQKPGMRVSTLHLLLPWPPVQENGGPPKSAEQIEAERQRLREIADQIRERAIETGDFAALTQQYSRAPSALDGGLTTFREGEVAPEIRAALFDLPPGEITPVIETEHGLNVFQIVNRFDPAEVSYEDVESNLRAELAERKVLPEFQKWIDELKQHRYIEILAPELRE